VSRLATISIGECVLPVRTWSPLRATGEQTFSYIDLSAVDQERKEIIEARNIPCADAPSRARQLLQEGDILISTVRPNLNGVARVRNVHHGATASTGFCVLRPDANKLDGAYAFQWVKSQRFIGTMVGMATGASYPAVSDRIVLASRIPLPSLAEQRRIAAILDQVDALRVKRREALAQLERLTLSIFIEMFGDPVANPFSWPRIDVGALADVQGGLQVTSARNDLPREVPYLRVANVHRGRLLLDEIKVIRATAVEVSRTRLRMDDRLVVEGHGNPNEIGRSALWTGQIAECVHQNHLIRVRFDLTKVVPEYACEYLNSPGGRRPLLRAAKTTSGLNTISVSNVRKAPIALPPLNQQQTFAARVRAVRELKSTQQAALIELDSLFASLQHRAFSGQLS
jgi:type I restriction enzyme S subunit